VPDHKKETTHSFVDTLAPYMPSSTGLLGRFYRIESLHLETWRSLSLDVRPYGGKQFFPSLSPFPSITTTLQSVFPASSILYYYFFYYGFSAYYYNYFHYWSDDYGYDYSDDNGFYYANSNPYFDYCGSGFAGGLIERCGGGGERKYYYCICLRGCRCSPSIHPLTLFASPPPSASPSTKPRLTTFHLTRTIPLWPPATTTTMKPQHPISAANRTSNVLRDLSVHGSLNPSPTTITSTSSPHGTRTRHHLAKRSTDHRFAIYTPDGGGDIWPWWGDKEWECE